MYSKQEAKERIAHLVEKYRTLEESGEIKGFNEEQAKKSFIDPLFESLGWDTSDHREVCLEDAIAGKRADYCFRMGGVPRFYLEAKAPKADTNRDDFMQQVINYAWLRYCNWAVLTNFQEIKVFNALWKGKSSREKLLFDIHYSQYVTRFEDLWLLSKESFLGNQLDAFAERVHKKAKRDPVTKQIFKDFMQWRLALSKNIVKHSKENNLTEEQVDEAVQRILDRLVFIRVCEDRKIEPESLRAEFRLWQANKKGRTLMEVLSKKFREFDKIYNSKLFAEHFCEKLSIDEEALEKIINDLYENLEGGYFYDFSAVDADVLGNIYEQYLGHILQKTPKRAKISETRKHRKEMGIYYTPTYIVDYIVKNTIGEKLKECKTPNEVEQIKVLDPACGSGSFLIKAFDEILNWYKERLPKDKRDKTWAIKNQILAQNIYGVDLDEKAVEIAQLNLLLKAVEKRHLLPEMTENIKCGNSLIEDKKISGRKAFNWKNEFKEITEGNGFDVIIGNPPYIMVENLQKAEREYMMSHFETALKRFDIYIGFIEKALKLLDNGGVVGFIVPYQVLTQDYAEKLREYILEKCTIRQIVDLSMQKVFEAAVVKNVILIVEKGKRNTETKIVQSPKPNVYSYTQINQSIFESIPEKKFRTKLDEDNLKIMEKITTKSIKLGKVAIASWGARGVPKEKFHLDSPINNLCKKMIKGTNVKRYSIEYSDKWFLYDTAKLYRPAFPELFENEKLVFRGVIDKRGMIASYDKEGYYTDHSLNCVILKHALKTKDESFFGKRKININKEDIELSKKFSLKFLLGVINSKLINFYFKLYFSDELHVYPEIIEQLPIPNISEEKQKPITELVDKILATKEKLNEIGDKKTDERAETEKKIAKTDNELNQMVYSLYAITEEEKKTIEST